MDYEKEVFSTLYVGERKSGKTTELIKRAIERKLPILAHTKKMKVYLMWFSEQLDLGDVEVITVEDLQGRRNYEKVLIDEPQLMLQRLLKVNVDAMAVTTYDLVDLGERKEWRDESE